MFGSGVIPADIAPPYFDWGFVHLSYGNLTVIVVMLLLFVLAIVVPFPGAHRGTGRRRTP